MIFCISKSKIEYMEYKFTNKSIDSSLEVKIEDDIIL